jgi:hypothetical protein
MRVSLHRTVVVALAAASIGLAIPATTASASGKPVIVAQEESAPYITGQNFTPFGPVVITERAVGVAAPVAKIHITANADGFIAQFGECDGNNQLTFKAYDVTTKQHSNKTPPAVYPCIN